MAEIKSAPWGCSHASVIDIYCVATSAATGAWTISDANGYVTGIAVTDTSNVTVTFHRPYYKVLFASAEYVDGTMGDHLILKEVTEISTSNKRVKFDYGAEHDTSGIVASAAPVASKTVLFKFSLQEMNV